MEAQQPSQEQPSGVAAPRPSPAAEVCSLASPRTQSLVEDWQFVEYDQAGPWNNNSTSSDRSATGPAGDASYLAESCMERMQDDDASTHESESLADNVLAQPLSSGSPSQRRTSQALAEGFSPAGSLPGGFEGLRLVSRMSRQNVHDGQPRADTPHGGERSGRGARKWWMVGTLGRWAGGAVCGAYHHVHGFLGSLRAALAGAVRFASACAMGSGNAAGEAVALCMETVDTVLAKAGGTWSQVALVSGGTVTVAAVGLLLWKVRPGEIMHLNSRLAGTNRDLARTLHSLPSLAPAGRFGHPGNYRQFFAMEQMM